MLKQIFHTARKLYKPKITVRAHTIHIDFLTSQIIENPWNPTHNTVINNHLLYISMESGKSGRSKKLIVETRFYFL